MSENNQHQVHGDRREFNNELLEVMLRKVENGRKVSLTEITTIIISGTATAAILWGSSTLLQVLAVSNELKGDITRMEIVHKEHVKEYKNLRKFTRKVSVLDKEIELLDKRIEANSQAHRMMLKDFVEYYRNPNNGGSQ